jgi:hypothetical protein
MKNSRAHRQRDLGDLPAAPLLRVVSPNAPARPRWGHLYLALVVAAAVGGALHFVVHGPWLSEAVDLFLWMALFAALGGWIHFNRLALARLDEPEAGARRPRVRIVRSRVSNTKRSAQDESDDRVVLPFDFR